MTTTNLLQPFLPLKMTSLEKDLSSGKVLDDKVKHLQLINAVSSNDLDGVLNAIFKINSAPSPPGATPPSYGSPLHLVTSLCQSNIVENVLNVFCHLDTTGDGGGVSSSSVQAKSLDWINCQNSPERETPLHIASKLARVDVLELLFQIPNVNDTIRDAHGLLAEECAPTELVRDVFESMFLFSLSLSHTFDYLPLNILLFTLFLLL